MNTPTLDEQKEDFRNMVKYFWQEKGDIERWSSFDRAFAEEHFPHVLDAWERHKKAEKILSLIVESL